MAEKKNPTIKKARQEVTYLTGDEAVKRIEFLREKWEMDRISEINHEKKLTEIETKIKTAKKLLEQGVSKEIVIKATGLTEEEIEKIIEENE